MRTFLKKDSLCRTLIKSLDLLAWMNPQIYLRENVASLSFLLVAGRSLAKANDRRRLLPRKMYEPRFVWSRLYAFRICSFGRKPFLFGVISVLLLQAMYNNKVAIDSTATGISRGTEANQSSVAMILGQGGGERRERGRVGK